MQSSLKKGNARKSRPPLCRCVYEKKCIIDEMWICEEMGGTIPHHIHNDNNKYMLG